LWNEATIDDSDHLDGELQIFKDKRTKIREFWQGLKNGKQGSWRNVLEAASFVARWESARQASPVPAFDLAMVAPETFSCLVLEVWFSEIFETLSAEAPEKAAQFAKAMEQRIWEESSSSHLDFANLVDKFWPELYRAWLLLVEVLDLTVFTARQEGFGFDFGRRANPNAVVVRHWYKSASLLGAEEEASGPMRFCRLPGTFSVRGDWFLATVRGSRSDRLADRAVDLLSTPAANAERLMRGLGLPTRKLNTDPENMSARLWGWRTGKSNPGTLTYAEVLALGASGQTNDFHWLWRGNLKPYYAIAPIWERWLYRILRRWKSTRDFVGTRWRSGFDLYDDIKENKTDVVKVLVSYSDFQRMRTILVNDLRSINS
jgi:hypothetical protein